MSRAEQIAVELREAMQGLGTRDNALIACLSHARSCDLEAAHKAFEEKFSRNLLNDVKSETSMCYKDTCVALITPTAELDAVSLRRAMVNPGTDEDRVSEVLLWRTAAELERIKEHFTAHYQRDLVDDVKDETSGHLQTLYMAALLNKGERKDPQADAHDLYNAGEGNITGTDEKVFAEVMGAAEPHHMAHVRRIYESKYGKSLATVIEDEMGILDGRCFKRALLQIANGHGDFLGQRLHKSMKGLGTDDNMLIRLIVTNRESACPCHVRDPNNPGRLECSFVKADTWLASNTSKNLVQWITSETSGNYKRLLLSIVDHWSRRSA